MDTTVYILHRLLHISVSILNVSPKLHGVRSMKTVYLICSPRDGPKERGWEVDRGGDGGDETGADKRVGVNRSKLEVTTGAIWIGLQITVLAVEDFFCRSYTALIFYCHCFYMRAPSEHLVISHNSLGPM